MVAAFLEVTEFNKDHEKVWDGGSTPKSWDFFVREIMNYSLFEEVCLFRTVCILILKILLAKPVNLF